LDVGGTTQSQVKACTASTSRILGVCQEGTEAAPTDGASTKAASNTNPEIRIFLDGETCMLTLGGTVVIGDWLTSDANGNGISAALSGANTDTAAKFYGAVALRSGNATEKIEVLVRAGIVPLN
jgi:hypothetical protein